MITSLLIANRGEIACRIIRTARRMGVRTVAVYSDADARALHVRQADEAIHIGPSPARESYLVGEKIIAAAKDTGAEAIHPGYGFLSENADFAQAVIDAGLIWVGPRPDSIRAMGLKDAAKERMIAAGVPVTPGYLGADQSPERLRAEADAIGYPVLIKAVAGGGGKGMRRVNVGDEFAEMLVSCQREAASSFGNTQVLIEKYVERPRHIEVQVFGDTHGDVVHLFERDCSLQRRHQKVIEEAPAPGMDEATREAICAAAVRAARAVDYVGAGTIEFIADASEGLRADRIWFMEMNTRLQVEHPVTEEITGVDLVEWQLRVASGEALPKRQDELSISGWAIEARLYAEDPAKGFLPSTGPLDVLKLPRPLDDWRPFRTRGQAAGLRIETGVEQGQEVSPFYDPMIAKIIMYGTDRRDALNGVRHACEKIEAWPVRTNAAFIVKLLEQKQIIAGDVDTGFIARHPELAEPPRLGDYHLTGALKLLRGDFVRRHRTFFGGSERLVGWRLNRAEQRETTIYVEGEARPARWDEDMQSVPIGFAQLAADEWVIFRQGHPYRISLERRAAAGGASLADGAIISPMPGKIIAVEVAAGQEVAKGQKLLTLEAMKMEHSLVAPFDGVVAELSASVGGQVSEGAVLARIEKGE